MCWPFLNLWIFLTMNHQSSVDPQEIAKFAQYADYWWDTTGPLKTLHNINPARLQFINQSIDLEGKIILDVGCGGGILSEAMAKAGAKVTGLDAEKEAIDVASLHAKQNELMIHYFCSPIEEYQAPCFDGITCMELLEHVPDPQLIVTHCARLLKPGGHLFLSTLNRTLKAYLTAIVAAEYLLKLLPRQTHSFEKFIKPNELARLIRTAGLELTGVSGLAYNPLNHSAALHESVAVNYLMVCVKPQGCE